MILSTALLCLASNIYFEARGEIIPGKYAVAYVTMERAHYDRKKVCDVVMQPHQFSWTTTGIYKTRSGIVLTRQIKDLDAWKKAKIIASIAIQGNRYNLLGHVTNYHALSVHPVWRLAMVPVKTIGHHRFYVDVSQQ